MSEYFVIKREPCPAAFCEDGYKPVEGFYGTKCGLCDGHSYIETQVNLLGVLRRLRWVDRTTHDMVTEVHSRTESAMANVRFEED